MPVTAERKIAVNEITTVEWSFTQDVEAYARADGVEGIGIWRNKLTGIEIDDAARRLQDAGLAVSSMGYIGGFTGEDFENKIEDARQAIDEAQQMGAETLIVYAGPRLGLTVEQANARVREALERLRFEALDAHVQLALEPYHPVDVTRYSSVVNLEQAYHIVNGVPGAEIVCDTWNVWWDPDLPAEIDLAKDQISLVQVADWQHPNDDPRVREVPGNGAAPLRSLIQYLENAGYSGWYEVELRSDRYPVSEYESLLEACVQGMRKVFPE